MSIKVSVESDESVVLEVLGGERERFGVLVERYQSTVRAIAYAYLRNDSDAADVVQESFVRAYESLEDLKDGKKFSGWLVAISRNCCFQIQKKRSRMSAASEIEDEAKSVHPEFEARELRRLVREQVESLDGNARELIFLYYFAGHSIRELESMLDLSSAVVKKRLQRAREKLAATLLDKLEPEEDAESKSETVHKVMGAVSALPLYSANAVTGGVSVLAAKAPATFSSLVVAVGIGVAVVAAGLAVNFSSGDDSESIPQTSAPRDEAVPPGVAESVSALSKPVGSNVAGSNLGFGTSAIVEDPPAEVELTPASVAFGEKAEAPHHKSESWTLLCKIVDENGRPVTGAAVRTEFVKQVKGEFFKDIDKDGFMDAFSKYEVGVESPDTPDYRVLKDDEWQVGLNVPSEANFLFLSVNRQGFVPWAEHRLNLLQPSKLEEGSMTVVLEYGSVVEGRVVDTSGKPVPGIEVEIEELARNGRTEYAVSADDGSFRLSRLSPGEYQVSLRPAGRSNMPDRSHHTLTVDSHITLSDVVLTYDPGLTISGRLLDEEGAPLSGTIRAVIREVEWKGGESITHSYTVSVTDAEEEDGAFLLGGFVDRDYLVTVRPNDRRIEPLRMYVRAGTSELDFVFPVPDGAPDEEALTLFDLIGGV